MTKEQASDLKSHVDRLVQTEVELQNATYARARAKNDLDNFVHSLQYPKQGI